MAESTESVAVPVDMNGKWKLDRNENLDEYLKAVGIGVVKRKIFFTVTPIMDVSQSGDDFQITVKMAVASVTTSFKVGVEQTENNPIWLDKERRVLAEWQGSKLVQSVVSTPEGDVDSPPVMRLEREIVDGEFVITMQRGNVTAKRYFKKL